MPKSPTSSLEGEFTIQRRGTNWLHWQKNLAFQLVKHMRVVGRFNPMLSSFWEVLDTSEPQVLDELPKKLMLFSV